MPSGPRSGTLAAERRSRELISGGEAGAFPGDAQRSKQESRRRSTDATNIPMRDSAKSVPPLDLFKRTGRGSIEGPRPDGPQDSPSELHRRQS